MWVITSDDRNDDGQNKHESATMRKKGKQTYKQTNKQTKKRERKRKTGTNFSNSSNQLFPFILENS